MHIVVLFCNMYALEEFVFESDTATDAVNRDIRLPSKRFRLRSDPVIALSLSPLGLTLSEENSNVYYHTVDRSKSCEGTFSKDVKLILKTRDGEEIKMLVFFESETGMQFFKIQRSRVISLGKGLNQDICCIDSDELSDAHILFRCSSAKDMMHVKGEKGCFINRKFIECMTTAHLNYGDVIIAGGIKLLWLKDYIGIARLKVSHPCLIRLDEVTDCRDMQMHKPDKTVPDHMAPPRNLVACDETGVVLDAPPPRKEIRRQPAFILVGPALTMAIPMCLGCGLYIYSAGSQFGGAVTYMYTGLVTALASALLGAMWAVINIRNGRRQELAEEELRVKSYTAYIESCDKIIRDKYRYNTSALKRNDPSLKDLFTASNMNVFNRRSGDSELFRYRLGTGSRPFDIKIEAPHEKFLPVPDELARLPGVLKKKYSMLYDVPICIDILKNRQTGFVSLDDEELSSLFINISLQIGATTGPDIVRMVFLFFDHIVLNDVVLKMMSFLPQVQGDDEHYISPDKERSRELICSLETTIRRMEHKGLRWILFTDDIRQIPLSLSEREDVSLMIFCHEFDSLPGACSLIVQNDPSYRGLINIGSAGNRCDVDFDRTGEDEALKYIRIIAGMNIRTEVISGLIPSKVTIPALFDTEFVPPEMIRANWNRNDTINSIMAPIGRAADDRTVFLDIHEKAHGPHGLIAGMTGSGKSELLATCILSLAIRYSPMELGFLLIDYKGGGMANLFNDLPHIRGIISNLSGNMIQRAMVSIRSENLRRQKAFLNAGVNSITDYTRLYRSGRVNVPLPHIIIIIDEFAELKRNEPDFMRELISVAQVGRSLGVHLILATQKPAGTVDDNIFSNSRFRICLRVQDKQDSNDMLHRPDAAFIKEAGRAFLQVGNDEIFSEFQTGYAMEPCEEKERKSGKMYLVDECGHRHEIAGDSGFPDKSGNDRGEKETHFSRIRENITECSKSIQLNKLSDLWLPPLGNAVILNEAYNDEDPFDIMIGKYDEPAAQLQGEYHINLKTAGHTCVCGSALSGKSTLLQTMIYGYIRGLDPEKLNVYIVDYSSGLLSCFRDSKNVGAYISEEDEGRLGNLFYMLADIMKARKKSYKGRECSPYILLVIDNYGLFREKTGGIYDKDMLEIVKFAEAYGIYVLLAASSIGSSDIPARLFENCKSGICLRMNDKYQYSECLRQVRLQVMPDDIRGRGLTNIDGTILEFQTAVVCEGDDLKRSTWIRERVDKMNEHYKTCAEMVPYIPEEATVADLEECADLSGKRGIAIGYEAVSGRPWYISDKETGSLVVAGRKGSGRGNVVRVYEYFAGKCGLKVMHASTIEEIIAGSRKAGLIICENIADVIESFYRGKHSEETENDFLKLFNGGSGIRYMFTMADKDYLKVAGLRLYEELIGKSQGLYLGGELDKQNIFDFSYLSFSEMCMAKPKGTGTLLKRKRTGYSGDIVIPSA